MKNPNPQETNPLKVGFNRFRFGFAEPGETMQSLGSLMVIEMVGNFSRKKDAEAAAASSGGKINPYLHGKLKRGWSVFKYKNV